MTALSTAHAPLRLARRGPSIGASSAGETLNAAEAALDRAVGALFAKQRPDGHWCAELEGDSILSSEYLLMKWILGQEAAPAASQDDLRRQRKSAVYLRMLQREDGTWGQYPGSPPDLSATVKAYFALKLMGDDRDAPHMARARARVLELGGAEKLRKMGKNVISLVAFEGH